MSNILLRTLKRVTALEVSLAEFTTIVFDNLNLSVYEVADGTSEVMQAHAEHAVSFLERPMPREGVALQYGDGGDLDGRGRIVGKTGFEFTRTRHRELCFIDEAEAAAVAARGRFVLSWISIRPDSPSKTPTRSQRRSVQHRNAERSVPLCWFHRSDLSD